MQIIRTSKYQLRCFILKDIFQTIFLDNLSYRFMQVNESWCLTSVISPFPDSFQGGLCASSFCRTPLHGWRSGSLSTDSIQAHNKLITRCRATDNQQLGPCDNYDDSASTSSSCELFELCYPYWDELKPCAFRDGLSWLQGAGTNERCLIEILASRTNEQIQGMVAAYKDGERVSDRVPYPFWKWCLVPRWVVSRRILSSSPAYGRDMEEDIVGDTSGHFKKMLVALLQVSELQFGKHASQNVAVNYSLLPHSMYFHYKSFPNPSGNGPMLSMM